MFYILYYLYYILDIYICINIHIYIYYEVYMFKVQVGEILQFSELAQQDGDLGIGEKSPPQNSSSMLNMVSNFKLRQWIPEIVW